MDRRTFLIRVVSQLFFLSVVSKAEAANLLSRWLSRNKPDTCRPASCFNNDYIELGYSDFYNNLYKISANGICHNRPATGDPLRPIAHELFHSKRLYKPVISQFHVIDLINNHNYSVKKVEFELECGVPVRGCMSIPKGEAKGLIYIAHGFATTPERCFNMLNPDYMDAIGARLSEKGFVVWCPFVPHGGNNPSLSSIAALFASQGIGFLNVLCSSLNSGCSIYSALGGDENISIGQYGVSLGSTTSCCLLAALDVSWPSVLSNGDFSDQKARLASEHSAKYAGSALIGFMMLDPGIEPFLFPQVADLTYPAPLYFEYGTEVTTGSEVDVIERLRKKYQKKGKLGHLIVSENFQGGHEANGNGSIGWLIANMILP